MHDWFVCGREIGVWVQCGVFALREHKKKIVDCLFLQKKKEKKEKKTNKTCKHVHVRVCACVLKV